jgi:hypothetical protein
MWNISNIWVAAKQMMQDVRTSEIKSKIAMVKAAFNRKKIFLPAIWT